MYLKIQKNILFAGAMLGNYLLFLPFFRLFKIRFPSLPVPGTSLCIEAYPRSGNTYFVSAVQRWNGGIRIAHHSHLAGSVKYAIEHGQPTVLLVRKPEDAVASALAWDNLLGVSLALLAYIHFYHGLEKHKEKFLCLSFKDVIERPDKCVDLINRKFGSKFKFEHFSPDVDLLIRSRVQKVDERNKRSGANSGLPNHTKTELKQKQVDLLVKSRLYPSARRLYLKFKSHSEKQWLAFGSNTNLT